MVIPVVTFNNYFVALKLNFLNIPLNTLLTTLCRVIESCKWNFECSSTMPMEIELTNNRSDTTYRRRRRKSFVRPCVPRHVHPTEDTLQFRWCWWRCDFVHNTISYNTSLGPVACLPIPRHPQTAARPIVRSFLVLPIDIQSLTHSLWMCLQTIWHIVSQMRSNDWLNARQDQ